MKTALPIAIVLALPQIGPEAEPGASLALEEVKRVAEAPAIDGRLNDPAWQQATRLSGLVELFVKEPGPAKLRTDGYVGYDREALYLAGRCHEERMDKVRATFTGRDNPLIWRDGCVELYFDPTNTGDQLYKVTIGAAGGVTDLWRVGDKLDLAWNAEGLETAVVRGPKSWDWEMALPWAALGVACPEGRMWTFCLVRFSYTTGRLVGATWSPGGHSGTPNLHGLLCFGPMLDSWVVPVAARRGPRWTIDRPDFELSYRAREATISDLADDVAQSLTSAAIELAPLPQADCLEDLRAQLKESRGQLAEFAPEPGAARCPGQRVRVQHGLEGLREKARSLHWECRIARLFADGR